MRGKGGVKHVPESSFLYPPLTVIQDHTCAIAHEDVRITGDPIECRLGPGPPQ